MDGFPRRTAFLRAATKEHSGPETCAQVAHLSGRKVLDKEVEIMRRGFCVVALFEMIAALLALLFGLATLGGCVANTEPIERAKNDVFEKILTPAIEKGIAELGQRTGQLQGQGSLINPGYRSRGYGIVGTGFVWDGTVETIGVSANVAAATQGDQGPDLEAPAASQPTN